MDDYKTVYEEDFGVNIVGSVYLDYSLLVYEVREFLLNSDLKDYVDFLSESLASYIIDFFISYDRNSLVMAEELISSLSDYLEMSNNETSYEVRMSINTDKFKNDLTGFLNNSQFLKNNQILNMLRESSFNIFPGKECCNVKEILLGV